MFEALYSDSVTLHLINKENLAEGRSMLQRFVDSGLMLDKLNENYLLKYKDGKRMSCGF
jgi:hypothetical protein